MTQNLEAIRRFLLSGLAIFTLTSRRTQDRRTFRVRAAEDVDGSGKPHGWYVDLLIGPNNTTDYQYLCFMFLKNDRLKNDRFEFRLNRKEWGADAFLAFSWLVQMIDFRDQGGQAKFERQAQFDHAGLCGRCGRTLTDPQSIDLGLGPICAGRAA